MRKSVIILLASLILFGYIGCSNTKKQTDQKKDFLPLIKPLLSVETLEKAGFEHLMVYNFNLLIAGDSLYLSNMEDSLIVKFSGNQPVKKYKEKSQGPGGFLAIRSLFLYDNNTIGVFDIQKCCVLFFDLDLNYKSEIRVNPVLNKIGNKNHQFIAAGDFPDKKLISLMDRNFVNTETFLTANLRVPFQTPLPPIALNRLYLLDENHIAYTYWLYLYKECVAHIYDTNSKKELITLKWEQEHSPTEKDMNNDKNFYSSVSIAKKMFYYVVNNTFRDRPKSSNTYNDILIFKENGELKYRSRTDIALIEAVSPINDTRIFFFDEDKGIQVLDVKEL